MNKVLILISLFVLNTVAYAYDYSFTKTHEAFDYECAHNDSGKVADFDVETFDPVKIRKEMEKTNTDWGCKYRLYSHSKENAIENTLEFVFEDHKDPFAESAKFCVAEMVSRYHQKNFIKLLNDEKTIAVFTDFYNYFNRSDDNWSEGCAYYHVWVYRNTGKVYKFVFNYTD